MCGIIGFFGEQAAQSVHLGLSLLQHRGQDATGMITMQGDQILMEKGFGTVEVFFDAARLRALSGNVGIGHVRYTTSGGAHVPSEIQPFYVNQPYGMALAHNGNLVNQAHLREWVRQVANRHVNSDSDSELLLNILAHFISESSSGGGFSPEMLFDAVGLTMAHCTGSYSVVAVISGKGLLAFRDPHGIRPLLLGHNNREYMIASENTPFQTLMLNQYRDIAPGEAIFIDMQGRLHQRRCADAGTHRPCIFEYIYLARPDSVIDGISVYKARLNMGKKLAQTIRRDHSDLTFDCVIPIPDSGRVAALELSQQLGIPYREALVKNRYSGRTFIIAGQDKRRQSVRKKLNVIDDEVRDKSILLVDDSIVRGTTAQQLVLLAREAGARHVYFASAAPPVCFPNVYGIDIPTRQELVAHGRTHQEIAFYLNADRVIYQSLEDLSGALAELNTGISEFEISCFNGHYPVGLVDENYLQNLESTRQVDRDNALNQGVLPLAAS